MSKEFKIAISVAVIGAVATILAAIIPTCKNESINQNNPSTITKPTKDLVNTIENSDDILEYDTSIAISNLDVKKIWEDINNVAPYQRAQVFKNYVGLKVKCKVALTDMITSYNEIYAVCFYEGSFIGIFFKADVLKYPILKTFKKGKSLMVTGVISQLMLQGFKIIATNIE